MLACDFVGLVCGSMKKKCSHAIKTSTVYLCLGCIFRAVLGNTLMQDPIHFGPFDSEATLNINSFIRTITTVITLNQTIGRCFQVAIMMCSTLQALNLEQIKA